MPEMFVYTPVSLRVDGGSIVSTETPVWGNRRQDRPGRNHARTDDGRKDLQSSTGTGNGGSIEVVVNDVLWRARERSTADARGHRNGGTVNITAQNVLLNDQSAISALTKGLAMPEMFVYTPVSFV